MAKRKSISKPLKSRKARGSNLQSMLQKVNARLHDKIASLEVKVISQNNRIKALEKQLSHGAVPQIDAELMGKASDLLKKIKSGST